MKILDGLVKCNDFHKTKYFKNNSTISHEREIKLKPIVTVVLYAEMNTGDTVTIKKLLNTFFQIYWP